MIEEILFSVQERLETYGWSDVLWLFLFSFGIYHLVEVIAHARFGVFRAKGLTKQSLNAFLFIAICLIVFKFSEIVMQFIGFHLPVMISILGPIFLILIGSLFVWGKVMRRQATKFSTFLATFVMPLTGATALLKAKEIFLAATKSLAALT